MMMCARTKRTSICELTNFLMPIWRLPLERIHWNLQSPRTHIRLVGLTWSLGVPFRLDALFGESGVQTQRQSCFDRMLVELVCMFGAACVVIFVWSKWSTLLRCSTKADESTPWWFVSWLCVRVLTWVWPVSRWRRQGTPARSCFF
jgi:hypothetical protein